MIACDQTANVVAVGRGSRRQLAAGVAALAVTLALWGCGETRTAVPPATFVRGCSGGVGSGGVSRFSQSQALHVGPLSLGALATLSLGSLDRARPGQTRFGALEDIAVIRAGTVVTVAVPPLERSYVGLIYDPAKFRTDGAYRISDLDSVVRFQACKNPKFNHGHSQYDGGIVVAGCRCFTLDFYIRGQPRVIRRRLPPVGCR